MPNPALPRTCASIVESTFADTSVDFDSSGVEFYCFDVDTSGLQQEVVDNQNWRPTTFAEHKRIRALRSGSTVSWSEYLTALSSSTAEGSQIAAATQLGNHLKSAWGGLELGYAAGVASSSSATITVESGEGANYEKGQFVCHKDATDDSYTWYRVESVLTDTLTVDRTVSPAGAAADSLMAVEHLYPDWEALTKGGDANATTLALALKGIDTEDNYDCFGCKPSVEIGELSQGSLPTLTFSALVTTFLHETITQHTLSDAPVGEAPVALAEGTTMTVKLADQGSALANVEAYRVAPRFGIAHVGIDGPGGTEGRHGYTASQSSFEDVGLELDLNFDDVHAGDFRADTVKHCLISMGPIAIYFPYLVVQSDPTAGRGGEDNVMVSVSFKALRNQASSGSLAGQSLARWYAPFHVLRAEQEVGT